MLGIIKRDLMLLFCNKRDGIFMLFYIPFLILIIDSYDPKWLYLAIIVAYTYIVSITSFHYDMDGKGRNIINSLPINGGTIVFYKYLSTFVYFIMTIVYAGVYLWIIDTLGLVHVDYFNIRIIINALPTVMIFTSIVYPAYFRFEPKIAQIVQMIVLMSFFIIISNISFTGDKGILKYIGILQWEQVMGIALVAYILSLVLSNQLYKNRDI